jgi:hypothetical protein
MLTSAANKVNPTQQKVGESMATTSQLPSGQIDPKEPQLEVSLNWFDKWHFKWSCRESTWNHLSERLTSPLNKGITIGTGIVIGVGATVHISVQIINHLNLMPRPTSIEAPAPKK